MAGFAGEARLGADDAAAWPFQPRTGMVVRTNPPTWAFQTAGGGWWKGMYTLDRAVFNGEVMPALMETDLGKALESEPAIVIRDSVDAVTATWYATLDTIGARVDLALRAKNLSVRLETWSLRDGRRLIQDDAWLPLGRASITRDHEIEWWAQENRGAVVKVPPVKVVAQAEGSLIALLDFSRDQALAAAALHR